MSNNWTGVESIMDDELTIQGFKITNEGGGCEYVGAFGYRVFDKVGRNKGFKNVLVSPNFKTAGERDKWIDKHSDMDDEEIIKIGERK